MPREVTKLYTLREIWRATGIHWPTLLQYSRDPRVQKHKVDAHPYPLWRHRSIGWFLKFRDRGVANYTRQRKRPPKPVEAEEVERRLEYDGAFEYDAGPADAATGEVETGAWSTLPGTTTD